MNDLKVLITGASGFVGTAVASRLQNERGITLRRAYRTSAGRGGNDSVNVGDIGPLTDWAQALSGVDVVVHCAARVHVMKERSDNPLAQFRLVNVHGTQNLARQAAAAGAKRFVFVSSIKVNGETTTNLPPFSHYSPAAPMDAYGISKWEAEQELWNVAKETGLEVVVVRPPLVYGPGVKANFRRLMQAVNRQIPLPFGSVHNQRSMVYVSNLADLLQKCVVHDNAASQTFLVSDGRDLSTPELVRELARAMHRKTRLINVPPSYMHTLAKVLGKADFADRLLGSLQVDTTRTCKILGWTPPITIEDGIRATVAS